MTVCRTILNIHTIVCTALVRRIAAADEGGIFNVHTVSVAVDGYIKANRLGLVRRDLTERYGQGLAGIVVLIFCGVAVYGYIAAESQSVRNGIGHNRVADIHIRTSRIGSVYGVGDRITDLAVVCLRTWKRSAERHRPRLLRHRPCPAPGLHCQRSALQGSEWWCCTRIRSPLR